METPNTKKSTKYSKG